MGGDSVEMNMLLRELWNDGEVSAVFHHCFFYRTECYFRSTATCTNYYRSVVS